MSVQVGIWNFHGNPIDRDLLVRFGGSLKHRGPDGAFQHVEGSIGFLYCPFHTTAESRREKQPYVTREDLVVTLDGRLDNREELIPALCTRIGMEETDVAIVAVAFERWGTSCFSKLIGDWAVSIWNPRERELICAVDYMAVRHIFYHLKADRLWWSTELSPLVLLSGEKFQVDDEYIAGYFANDPDAHLTPYQDIREVPPGQFVRFSAQNTSIRRYWQVNPQSRIRYKSDPEYEEHFRYLFRQSVRRRLRSDSPVLAELSGGLDSSSIVCMADDILAKQEGQTPRLDTVSYHDTTEPHGDDWTYFRKIEEKRGKAGAHIDFAMLGSSPSQLDYAEFVSLPGYLGSGRQLELERAKVLRQGQYRVVLSGLGGDEFLGGIPDPRDQLADLIVQFKFIKLAEELIAWSLIKRKPWIHLLAEASIYLLPSKLRRYFTKQADVEAWIDKEFAKRTEISIRLLDVKEHFGMWLPTRRSSIASVLLMANKLAKWRTSSLALEETRYPYLDQNLLEFILSIPASQLLRPGQRRWLMRRALAGIVPDIILSRRTKQFMARTYVLSLNKNLQQLQHFFQSPLSSALGYIDQEQFLTALNSARNGKKIHTVRLLRTISLELWLRDLAARGLLKTVEVPPSLSLIEPLHADA